LPPGTLRLRLATRERNVHSPVISDDQPSSGDREYLADRVRALDAAADPAGDSATAAPEALTDHEAGDEISRDVDGFIRVLRRVFHVEGVRIPVVTAHDADVAVAASRLLARLGDVAPQIVSGSLDRSSQYWISTAKFPWLKPRDPHLSEDKFATVGSSTVPSAKPFYVGLYTYTGVAGSRGMWREYIEHAVSGTGFERPWHVWKICASPSARVWEVNTASSWAALGMHYPLIKDGLIYPDWSAIAEDYDAVHLTAMAIAAIQGVRVSTEMGLLAPSYWDVESTLWLRWRFEALSEVEIVS
jgi:hypothetical protein